MNLAQAVTPLCESCRRTGAATVEHVDGEPFLLSADCASIAPAAVTTRVLEVIQ